ncbi:MAG TPA: tetratricopeptide repeat protein [Chitinophagaceae bacterium]|nr:tetratricopeptide repeat protein [Chitinophagaceae bacterium]
MKSFLFPLVLAGFIASSVSAQTSAADWYEKGNSLKNDEDYKGAMNAFKKAVSLDAKHKLALHQLAWCYNELSMYNEAIDVLKKEAKLNPSFPEKNNFELGFAYKGLENYEEALKYLNKAISIDGNYALAFKERGKCYFELQNYESALNDFNRYETLEDDIDEADFYYDKGWIENDLGQYNDAVESLKKCLELDDSYTDGYSELGFAYYKLNLNNEAVRNYRVAIEQDPADYHPVIWMGDVYFDNIRDYDSAIVYYEKGLNLYKKDKVAFYKLGWCYNDKERYSAAVTPLKEAVKLDPNYDEALTELGFAYYKMEQYDMALTQYNSVISRNDKDELCRYSAGLCYYAKNDQASLKRMISELSALNSTKYVEELTKYIK